MPCRQVTQSTWAESRGQHYILNILGLRIWRPDSRHTSRRPLHRRGSPAAGAGERYEYHTVHDDVYEDSHPHCRGQYPDGRSAALDSWEHFCDDLPFDDGDDRFPAPPSYGRVEPHHEVREPDWAREEEDCHRDRYPRERATSERHADIRPRFRSGNESRRPHRANGSGDRFPARPPWHARPPAPSPGALHYPCGSCLNHPYHLVRASPSYFNQDGGSPCGGYGDSDAIPPPAPDPPTGSIRRWQSHVGARDCDRDCDRYSRSHMRQDGGGRGGHCLYDRCEEDEDEDDVYSYEDC